jgi:hydroxymethylbilane synthase
MAETIILGTRGSELALAQARLVTAALQERSSDLKIEIRTIRTSGDESAAPLAPDARAGRKGLFTSEIEGALLAGEIDLAVHSAKDLPSDLNPATRIAGVLPRARVDDVLISPAPFNLESLPVNARVATGSVRRRHQLRWKRPDLDIVDLHGNVPTRLRKLVTSGWHGVVLACAGLERLGLKAEDGGVVFEGTSFTMHLLDRQIFLPAGGQGVIAMQVRADDARARLLAESSNHLGTQLCLKAEREFLRLLHGDCNQPVGVWATVEGAIMKISAQVFDLEATIPREATMVGPSADAAAVATKLFAMINGR